MKKADVTTRRLTLRRLRRQKLGWESIRVAVEKQFSTDTKQFSYSLRTYQYDIAALIQQDKNWAEKEASENFLSSFRLSIESLEETQRRLNVIAQTAAKDSDKIDANAAIAEIELMIVDLYMKGPTVIEYDRRMRSLSRIDVPKGIKAPPGPAPEEQDDPRTS